MRSPVVAMLWETWRVTRTETAWKLALGIVGGIAALSVSPAFATDERGRAFFAIVAMMFIVMPHFLGWLSIQRFNGGRPGFPFRLLFARPVRTAAIVGLPMAYLITVPPAIYLASALLLKTISGQPFPLLPVAAWLATLNLVYLAINWSTRSKVSMSLGVMVVSIFWFRFAVHRLTDFPDGFGWHDSTKLWPAIFDFPLTDYALSALLGLACFGVTVARVARQRSGYAPVGVARTPGAGYPEWLVNLFRFGCPTSSALRAQLWFDLKSRGLPLLTIGVALAIVIALLCAIGGPIDAVIEARFRESVSCAKTGCFHARPLAILFTAISVLAVAFFGGNAFSIRWRGRSYLSPFEATQAFGTARLAGLKLLARAACLLAVFIAVGASAWMSLPLLGDAVFIQMVNVPLSTWQRAITSAFAALDGYELLALLVVAVAAVVVWVATFAVVGALWARYPRRGNIATSVLLLLGLALGSLAAAERYGIVPAFLVNALFAATRWIAVAAMVFATFYVFARGFAERVLTRRYAGGALVISASCAAAWLTVLHVAGVQLAGMSATNAVSILSPALLPLMVSVLTPWSLNRIRHM